MKQLLIYHKKSKILIFDRFHFRFNNTFRYIYIKKKKLYKIDIKSIIFFYTELLTWQQ